MHVAIIMDGNGRWAKSFGNKRTDGHKIGAQTARKITKKANDLGIKYLTLYAFSTENWRRPKLEVDFLMKLLGKYLKEEERTYQDNNIRFKAIGDLTKLSKKLQSQINNLQIATSNNTGITQILAINYGARDEIIRACEKLQLTQNKAQTIEEFLDTKDIPDVDLLIRTGGEKRLSNFLLWQSAYAELFFTDTLWPDFNEDELETIIKEFNGRQRRFGGL